MLYWRFLRFWLDFEILEKKAWRRARMHRGVKSGSKKDNAPLADRGKEAQSARRSAEETLRREEQKKIESGRIPKWNGWSC